MPRKSALKCYFGCVPLKGKLHHFPPTEYPYLEKFNEWKMVLSEKDKEKGDNYIYNNIRICDRHFERFYQTAAGRLTKNAVPTINIAFSSTTLESPEMHLTSCSAEQNEIIDNVEVTHGEASRPNSAEFLESADFLNSAEFLESDFRMDEDQFTVAITLLPTNQCGVCLSFDRKLSPMGELQHILRKIVMDFDYETSFLLDSMRLCWECMAVLRKIYMFKKQLQKALTMIHLGQNHITSLSNLATFILNDNQWHPHIVSESHTHVNQASVNDVQNDGENQYHDEVLLNHCAEEGTENQEKVVGSTTVEAKRPKTNRWAPKKTSQNKKPKLKIRLVTDYTSECFNKLQIKYEDVFLHMKNEKESEYFKFKRHKCLKCAMTFLNEELYKEHVGEYHDKVTPYICNICDSRTLTKLQLVRHMRNHCYKYSCTLCDFSCYDKSQRQWHYRKKHPKILQFFKSTGKISSDITETNTRSLCEYCGISFKMRYCIKNHIRVPCPGCDKVLTKNI